MKRNLCVAMVSNQYFYLKSDLWMDETGVPRSNHRSATSY